MKEEFQISNDLTGNNILHWALTLEDSKKIIIGCKKLISVCLETYDKNMNDYNILMSILPDVLYSEHKIPEFINFFMDEEGNKRCTYAMQIKD